MPCIDGCIENRGQKCAINAGCLVDSVAKEIIVAACKKLDAVLFGNISEDRCIFAFLVCRHFDQILVTMLLEIRDDFLVGMGEADDASGSMPLKQFCALHEAFPVDFKW